MTVVLNPRLFNLLVAQNLLVANQDGNYTEQDGKKLKVVIKSGAELEVA